MRWSVAEADRVKRYPQLNNKEWLRKKHVEEGLDAPTIAGLVGCSKPAARNALIRHGLYRPRPHPTLRVLCWVTGSRLMQDAATVTSWWSLARKYEVQVSVVQSRALELGVFEEVERAFLDHAPRREHALVPNERLESRDWIAQTWAKTYILKDVARSALVTKRDLQLWLSRQGMSSAQMRDARDWSMAIEYEMGATLGEISEHHGIDQAAVWRILKTMGVSMRGAKGRRRSVSIYSLLTANFEAVIETDARYDSEMAAVLADQLADYRPSIVPTRKGALQLEVTFYADSQASATTTAVILLRSASNLQPVSVRIRPLEQER